MARVLILSRCHKKPEYFQLIKPAPGENDFYRQTTSLNAFLHGRRRSRPKNGTVFNCYEEWEWQLHKKQWDRIREKYPEIEDDFVIEKTFHSVWEFYEHIGYNYKTKKFNK